MNLEEKAAKQHEVWSHWMKYLFETCGKWENEVVIPSDLVKKWERQMNTEYKDLTEKEKQSDRDIVTKFKL
jgi:hypothetical protein